MTNIRSRKRVAAAVTATAALALIGTATACSSNDDSSDSAASSSADSSMAMPMSSETAASSSAAHGAEGGHGSHGASTPTEINTSTELTTVNGKKITIGNEAIAASYGERGGPEGYLGKPLGPVVNLPSGGSFITLEHGSLYENPESHKVFAVHGEIGDYWGTLDHERGRLGYPTSDETKEDGGLVQKFQKGSLTFKDGKVTVS